MTAITRNPTNPNPLIGSRFILSFGRVPNVQYFCQSVSVPGISLSEAVIVNPFVDIYSPGEKAIYDLLNVTFMVDEDFARTHLNKMPRVSGIILDTDLKEITGWYADKIYITNLKEIEEYNCPAKLSKKITNLFYNINFRYLKIIMIIVKEK